MKNGKKQLSEFIVTLMNRYKKLGFYDNEECQHVAEMTSNIPGMRIFKEKYRCGYGKYKIPSFSDYENASKYLYGIFIRYDLKKEDILEKTP